MTDKILDQYISVSLLGSGWAAIHFVEVLEQGKKMPYWDVQQTGIGRYKTKQEAISEAKLWAEAEKLKYKE